MFVLLIALHVAAAQPAQPLVPVVEPSRRIAEVLAERDGRSEKTAYSVKNIDEEYEILRVFGLSPGIQSLVTREDGKAYDRIEAANPRTGETVQLWFDISSFFGKEY